MLKKNSSKSAVAASVISLALCFVMLLGTTFAWWSASTSSLVNTVKSGNLYIDLVDSSDTTLVGKTLAFVDAGEDTLWEPGCSYTVEDVYLKNTGTCNIKYKISVIGVDGDNELADVITWKIDGQDATTFEGRLASGETTDAIKLTGSMDKNAGNRYMDKTADGIAIAVYATQDNDEATYEEVVALIKELDEMPTVTPEGGNATVLDTAIPSLRSPEHPKRSMPVGMLTMLFPSIRLFPQVKYALQVSMIPGALTGLLSTMPMTSQKAPRSDSSRIPRMFM